MSIINVTIAARGVQGPTGSAFNLTPGDGIIIDGVPGTGTDPFDTLIAAGTGIDVAYDSGVRTWTITNTGGGGGGGADLSVTTTTTNVTVVSSSGDDAIIAAASTAAAGVMTKTMFDKLDGIANNATANDTDANLRARSSHTGTQAWSTITSTPTTLSGYGISDAVGTTGDQSIAGVKTLTDTLHLTMTTITYGATMAVDAAAANKFAITLAGNGTINNPTNAVDGRVITFRLRQDGGGSRIPVWDTKYRFSGDLATVTLSTTAAAIDRIAFEYESTDDRWDCISFIKGTV